jgi:hypothetical protein
MNIKKILIDRVAAYLLGADIWGEIQGVIRIVEDPNIDGSTKRKRALEMLGKCGVNIAGFLLNLGLELAVAKLRMTVAQG